MNVNSILSASLFSVIAALSMGAQAASDTDKAAEAKAPAAGMQAGKKMKPHSHMEEKTGVPQQMSSAPAAEEKSPKTKTDKDRHLHPRDGK